MRGGVLRFLFLCAAIWIPALIPGGRATAQTIEAVSIADPSFNVGASGTTPQISGNGRYVVFSSASGLNGVGVPPGTFQVYRHDRLTGTTILISQGNDGSPANQNAGGPIDGPPARISEDGNVVVFTSKATNLVPGVTGSQLYARNVSLGTTRLVSQSTAGVPGNDAFRSLPVLSTDGNLVLFSSTATNLVPGVSTSGQLYVRNLAAGTTELVSRDSNGVPASYAAQPSINEDGTLVAFEAQFPGNERGQIYLRNLSTGTTTLVSQSTEGMPGDLGGYQSAISRSGTVVTFLSQSQNLVPGVNNQQQVYARNLATGTTTLVSRSSGGSAAGIGADSPVISGNGSVIAFVSGSANLVKGVRGIQIYTHNLITGQTILVSESTGGAVKNITSTQPVINDDGTVIAFRSLGAIPGLTGGQIFVRNLAAGTTTLASQGPAAAPANGSFGNPNDMAHSISLDGKTVAFLHNATNLVPGSSGQQVYIRDLNAGTTTLGSPRAVEYAEIRQTSDNNSSSSKVSADGRFVFYVGGGSNIAPGIKGTHIYRYDRQTRTTVLVTQSTEGVPFNGQLSDTAYRISANGNIVAFVSNATNLAPGTSGNQVYVRNISADTTILASRNEDGIPADRNSDSPVLNAEGTAVAFSSPARNLLPDGNGFNQVFVRNLLTGTISLASRTSAGTPGTGYSRPEFLGSDGRRIVFGSTATNLGSGDGTFQIYTHNLATGLTALVSRSNEGQPANNHIDRVSVGADGNLVVFETSATNLTPGTTPDIRQFYVRDLAAGVTTLVTQGLNGEPGNGLSLDPVISADGSAVVYFSFAKNLTPDPNDTGQVYVRNLRAGTTVLVGVVPGNTSALLSGGNSISADGNRVTLWTGDNQLWVRDLTTGTSLYVSRSNDGPGANLGAQTPVISTDGTTVVFQSRSLNLVRGDSNLYQTDIFAAALPVNRPAPAARPKVRRNAARSIRVPRGR